jgi:hypothetical protein
MARRRLPSPEMLGFSGYVKWQGFDPVVPPNVRSKHSKQLFYKLMCQICLYKYIF